MRFVIVGAGLAGAKAAEELRGAGFDGDLVVLGRESEPPYERPPLSKGYLWGESPFDDAFVHPRPWYDEHDVHLRLGVAAVGLDPRSKRLSVDDGSHETYDKLLIATGVAPVRLNVPGAQRALYLRTKDDSDRIRAALAASGRVVVVGGGWIGLEVAAAAVKAGCDVTVVDIDDLPLERALGAEVAAIYAEEHRRHGVRFVLGAAVREITSTSVVTDDETLPADAVVVGIGAGPDTRLAEAGGLAVANGIRTEASLVTTEPDIYAAGDVASAFHPRYGEHIRVEHWANALNQGRAAARSMLGEPVSYQRTPYLYSDQYDMGMEYSGWVRPGSSPQVALRGDVAGRSFQAFWLADGDSAGRRVIAAMHVNRWDEGIDPLKALVESARSVGPDELVDEGIDLAELAEGT